MGWKAEYATYMKVYAVHIPSDGRMIILFPPLPRSHSPLLPPHPHPPPPSCLTFTFLDYNYIEWKSVIYLESKSTVQKLLMLQFLFTCYFIVLYICVHIMYYCDFMFVKYHCCDWFFFFFFWYAFHLFQLFYFGYIFLLFLFRFECEAKKKKK